MTTSSQYRALNTYACRQDQRQVADLLQKLVSSQRQAQLQKHLLMIGQDDETPFIEPKKLLVVLRLLESAFIDLDDALVLSYLEKCFPKNKLSNICYLQLLDPEFAHGKEASLIFLSHLVE